MKTFDLNQAPADRLQFPNIFSIYIVNFGFIKLTLY